jgi:hypothetical protein
MAHRGPAPVGQSAIDRGISRRTIARWRNAGLDR